MKYIFIAVVFFCIWFAGLGFCSKYKKQMKICESFERFLHFARSEVSFTAKPVGEIVEAFTASNEELNFLNACCEPIFSDIKVHLDNEHCLNVEQKHLIEAFFESFGSSDTDSSIDLIEEYCEKLKSLSLRMRAENDKKTELIKKLSFFAAAAVAVILI